ncbi:MAG: family NAD(P)-dependent oxidoreductase [Ilumatobacteraceae bacterium]|nr:family NAD(P)-dependent oxidoreductase [Ilumatobacteraceae bacterium]
MGRFDGQVAIVTGAGGGLGEQYALLLAREGARVVVNDYGGDNHGNRGDSQMADAVVAQIRSEGGEAVANSADVATDPAAIVQAAIDAFGGLHVVVNNAGISGGGTLETITVADFERMLAIHLGGTLGVARAAWPIMRAQGYGRIVNTSSASVFGLAGTSAYITAKAAIFGLTRALGRDGRSIDVKVNAVMPSAYSRLTAQSPEFAPVMQAGFPPAAAAAFVGALASRDVPCTAETFVVGGGRAARVVLGTVPGLTGITSIDDALGRFDEAMSLDDLFVPDDATQAVVYECGQIGIDIAALLGSSASAGSIT